MIQFNASEWKNLDEIEADELLKEIRPQAEMAVKVAVVHMEGAVKKTLTGTRSGRPYRVPLRKGGKAAKLHIASAPGEPPAVLFNNLRGSVGHTNPRWFGPYRISAEYGPGIAQGPGVDRDAARAYARRLEYGGTDSRGIRILPRPYMEPTEQREEPAVTRILARAVGSE